MNLPPLIQLVAGGKYLIYILNGPHGDAYGAFQAGDLMGAIKIGMDNAMAGVLDPTSGVLLAVGATLAKKWLGLPSIPLFKLGKGKSVRLL